MGTEITETNPTSETTSSTTGYDQYFTEVEEGLNIVAHNIEGTSYGAVKENTQGQTTTYRDVAPAVATCEVPQIPSQTVAVTSPQVTVMGTNQPQTQVQQPQIQPAYSAVVNQPYDYQAPQFTDKINSDDDLPF